MFDVGFWEISLILVICLLVVGPERLPKLARTLGAYLAKARRMVADVKAEVDRELKADEFRSSASADALKQIKEVAREARSAGQQLKAELDRTITTESAPRRPAPDDSAAISQDRAAPETEGHDSPAKVSPTAPAESDPDRRAGAGE